MNEWYTFEEARLAMGCSVRTARADLAKLPSGATRPDPDYAGRGRPPIQYHYSANAALLADWRGQHKADAAEQPANEPGGYQWRGAADPELGGATPQELALARLRAQAVEQYRRLRVVMPEDAAARDTAEDWERRPRSQDYQIVERLPGGRTRVRDNRVVLRHFSVSTLRGWHSLYIRKEHNFLALAPRKRGRVGKKELPIEPSLLDMVQAIAVSYNRAGVESAVAAARRMYRGDFPDVSIWTWRRRLLARDPEGSSKTLGKRGVQSFRYKHSPQIERSHLDMAYNEEWQLDDVTEDFYGHAFDHTRITRPFVYAVIRVATRQWICAVACETPITQDQVRSLVGIGMASRFGGVPDRIRFERGSIACDNYLENLLVDLGVTVNRTSMDGGKVHGAAYADRDRGHAAGKGVIERAIRTHHGEMFMELASTGPDERRTGHSNLETIKAEAERRAKTGEQLILPTPEQWQTRIFEALARQNNKEHRSHPKMLDAETGKPRHMTPNEYGAHLLSKCSSIRIMPEVLLPLFFEKGYEMEVAAGWGIRINNFTYGRFDLGLQDLAGKRVLVYALKEYPEVVYVRELGRVVERYLKPSYDANGELVEQKRAIERGKRNQFEDLIARAAASETPVTVDSVRFTPNLAAKRMALQEVCVPDALLQRAAGLARGIEDHQEKRNDLDRRVAALKGEPKDAELEPAMAGAGPSLAERLALAREEVELMR